LADLTIIGGGLAGCEAAWQAAESGLTVDLIEMRPKIMTGAHRTGGLAELVCSNSLGSNLPDRASGLLKEELRRLESLLLKIAEETALPAGAALAVDRDAFSQEISSQIEMHPSIQVTRVEATTLPAGPTIIASGPLTSDKLAQSIQAFTGEEQLYFYDAIAPVVTADSINKEIAFRGSRFGHGEQSDGDYFNCPMDEAQYLAFVTELRTAERFQLREFEMQIHIGVKAGFDRFFEGCLPIEIIAERGDHSLAFGTLRPIGLHNPLTGQRMHAIVQLRQDNQANTLYNMVGFQTNLTYSEQRRVLRMIPGLENAEFARYGQMHRNTFIASPKLLLPTLQSRQKPDLFFAGQITGVEGYMGNIATGWLAGRNAARFLSNQHCLSFPPTTMIGALCTYITEADLKDFQPMKANFGILPRLDSTLRSRKDRNSAYVQRALDDLETYMRLVG
jgi:methylenetetrahydrofolate--tRNA-(uracil-5-)-methyltransferase